MTKSQYEMVIPRLFPVVLVNLVVIFGFINSQEVRNKTEKEVFYLLTQLPYFNSIPSLNPSWDGGDDVQPALNLAMDQINRHDGFLDNYTLQLVHGDSGCDRELTVRTLENFVTHGYMPHRKGVTGIIGPGCSSSSAALAPLVGRPDISLVAVHGAGSHTLANRTNYPHLLGVLGTTESFAQSFQYLLERGNWSRIGILYDSTRMYYSSVKSQLLERIEKYGASQPKVSVNFLSTVSNIFIPIRGIQEEMLRIVFIMCPLELTRYALCLSRNMNNDFREYQWVIMSRRMEELVQPVKFTLDGVFYNCSSKELMEVLERAFLLNYNLLPDDDADLISNVTYTEFLEDYQKYREIYNSLPDVVHNSSYTYWATYLYDAVWAWAVVLDNLTKTHHDFTITSAYGDVERSKMIVEQFYRTSFQGMSGPIAFSNQTGFVSREVMVQYITNSEEIIIALIDPDGGVRCSNGLNCTNSTEITFIDDSFPSEILRESKGLAIFFVIVTILELFITVMLHIVTTKYSNSPSIRASSPKLLHLSYIGVYLLVTGTFMWSFYSAVQIQILYRHYFCQILWAWTLPVGFTLSFTPVAMRTWRIYRIFKHYLNPGRFISNRILISVVVCLTVLNLIVAVIWTAVDPLVLKEAVHFTENRHTELTVRQVDQECTCKYFIYWRVLIAIMQMGLLLLVTTFAVLTRHMGNSSFTTSSLRVMMYLLSIIITFLAILYALIELLNIEDLMYYFRFTIISFLVNAIICVFILCVFLPPIIPVLRETKVKITSYVTVVKNL